MKIKKVLAMCLISAMVLGSFAGCGKDEGESTVSVNQEDPAWKEAMTTPYGKYPETVNYTLGKTVTNFDVLDGTKYEGDDDENNAWTRYLKEKLNVQNTNLFEANDGDDYEQKVSMAIVSGEIPDIMGVGDYDTLKQLYENDLIADLTEVYENCASDKIKEIYDSYDGVPEDSHVRRKADGTAYHGNLPRAWDPVAEKRLDGQMRPGRAQDHGGHL